MHREPGAQAGPLEQQGSPTTPQQTPPTQRALGGLQSALVQQVAIGMQADPQRCVPGAHAQALELEQTSVGSQPGSGGGQQGWPCAPQPAASRAASRPPSGAPPSEGASPRASTEASWLIELELFAQPTRAHSGKIASNPRIMGFSGA